MHKPAKKRLQKCNFAAATSFTWIKDIPEELSLVIMNQDLSFWSVDGYYLMAISYKTLTDSRRASVVRQTLFTSFRTSEFWWVCALSTHRAFFQLFKICKGSFNDKRNQTKNHGFSYHWVKISLAFESKRNWHHEK